MTILRLPGALIALLLACALACSGSPKVSQSPDAAPVSGCGTVTLPPTCNTNASDPCTVTVAGKAREFFVVPPTNYDPNTPTPVVFAWHYYRATAKGLAGSNGPSSFYGIRAGFPDAIYVAGQGLPLTDGGYDYGWPNAGGQDVDFAKAMLAWLQVNYCVDQSRIFSTGLSYGGTMSNTLGCQVPDIFRALAVMSGGVDAQPGTSCAGRPIAAWFTHGDADTDVPIAAGMAARDFFIANNGCSPSDTQQVVLAPDTTCTVYSACTAGNYPVVWCPVIGGGHTQPSWAATEIAKFFGQF